MQPKGENGKQLRQDMVKSQKNSLILKSSQNRQLDLSPTGENSPTKPTFASGYEVQLQEINFLCQRHILGLLTSSHLEHFLKLFSFLIIINMDN